MINFVDIKIGRCVKYLHIYGYNITYISHLAIDNTVSL